MNSTVGIRLGDPSGGGRHPLNQNLTTSRPRVRSPVYLLPTGSVSNWGRLRIRSRFALRVSEGVGISHTVGPAPGPIEGPRSHHQCGRAGAGDHGPSGGGQAFRTTVPGVDRPQPDPQRRAKPSCSWGRTVGHARRLTPKGLGDQLPLLNAILNAILDATGQPLGESSAVPSPAGVRCCLPPGWTRVGGSGRPYWSERTVRHGVRVCTKRRWSHAVRYATANRAETTGIS